MSNPINCLVCHTTYTSIDALRTHAHHGPHSAMELVCYRSIFHQYGLFPCLICSQPSLFKGQHSRQHALTTYTSICHPNSVLLTEIFATAQSQPTWTTLLEWLNNLSSFTPSPY